MSEAQVCSHDGCGNPVRAKGLCPTHWWQMKKHGTTWDAGTKWKRLSEQEVDGALLLIARGATTDEVAEVVGLPSGKTLTHHLRKSAAESLQDALTARSTAPHGTVARYHRGCRCPDCRRSHADKERKAEDREAGILRRHVGTESVTSSEVVRLFRDRAVRWGHQWTGPEIETALATNDDGTWLRTSYEVANLLGRSLHGVDYIRRRRTDPRIVGML